MVDFARRPFEPTRLEEEREKDRYENITVRLNKQERKELDEAKRILEQTKDSTALKQLAEIGKIVLHRESTGKVLETLFINKRRNKRLGIPDFD